MREIAYEDQRAVRALNTELNVGMQNTDNRDRWAERISTTKRHGLKNGRNHRVYL